MGRWARGISVVAFSTSRGLGVGYSVPENLGEVSDLGNRGEQSGAVEQRVEIGAALLGDRSPGSGGEGLILPM